MSKPYDWFDQAAVALLADLPAWRLRAVERVELSSAFWSERDREIHVRPLVEAMRAPSRTGLDVRRELTRLGTIRHDRQTGERTIDLVLPIADLPKIPVLDLKITVAGKSVYRIPKDESARIQARYVRHLAECAGYEGNEGVERCLTDFLAALFYFPAHPYGETWKRYHCFTYGRPELWVLRKLEHEHYRYLDRSGIGARYDEWKAYARDIHKRAKSYVIPDYASGTEHPLIALPYLFQEIEEQRRPRERWVDYGNVGELLEYLSAVLAESDGRAKERDAAAEKFISAYFGYGYRWMVFARCRVPIDKPFIIEMKERRAIYFTPYRKPNLSHVERLKKEAWQMVSFADAETNHVSVRLTDTAVRMGRPEVQDEKLERIDAGVDEEASTFELYLRHDSSRDRKERIYIKFPLRLTRLHSGMLYLTMIVTGLGIFLLFNRGLAHIEPAKRHDPTKQKTPLIGNGLTAKDATLVLVPVAFAASFLLIRDSSTLSAWIRRIRQSIVLFELLVLLVTAFVLVWVHHIKAG